MQYTKLGTTELNVSKICLGCMAFGDPERGIPKWSMDEKQSEEIIMKALDLGINFFDTANVYSEGTSEEYIGKALRNNRVPRDKVILASKVFSNKGHLSKEAIYREIDKTLKNFGTDYLDLYLIHRFDYKTPIEETMEALNELVVQGKVRAIGASSMYGYQFYNMQLAARDNGWTPFAVMQNHYNLLYREDERELIPICEQMKVARTPYSPMASGRLSRMDWHTDSLRSQIDATAMKKYDSTEDQDYQIVVRVHELAEKYNATMSQVALAWHFAKGVTAPVVGATKGKYIEDAVGALDIQLTEEDVAYLEELYVPHAIAGPLDWKKKK